MAFLGTMMGAVRAAKSAAPWGKVGKAAVAAMTISQAVTVYNDDRQKNMNPLLAGAHGVGEALLWQEFFAPMMVFEAAKAIPGVGRAINQQRANQQKELMTMSPFRFQDSEYAQTTRQRALQAITESRGRARDYIGREAGLYAARYR